MIVATGSARPGDRPGAVVRMSDAEAITGAKTDETRQRRLATTMDALAAG